MHEKHKEHESMHAEMILILFATLIISQIALVKWRQTYPNSYHVSSLCLVVIKYFKIDKPNAMFKLIGKDKHYYYSLTALYFNWNVGHSIFSVSQKCVDTFYCDMVAIYIHNCNCHAKSVRKTNRRIYTEVIISYNWHVMIHKSVE